MKRCHRERRINCLLKCLARRDFYSCFLSCNQHSRLPPLCQALGSVGLTSTEQKINIGPIPTELTSSWREAENRETSNYALVVSAPMEVRCAVPESFLLLVEMWRLKSEWRDESATWRSKAGKFMAQVTAKARWQEGTCRNWATESGPTWLWITNLAGKESWRAEVSMEG